jgi:hypothetical protein
MADAEYNCGDPNGDVAGWGVCTDELLKESHLVC